MLNESEVCRTLTGPAAGRLWQQKLIWTKGVRAGADARQIKRMDFYIKILSAAALITLTKWIGLKLRSAAWDVLQEVKAHFSSSSSADSTQRKSSFLWPTGGQRCEMRGQDCKHRAGGSSLCCSNALLKVGRGVEGQQHAVCGQTEISSWLWGKKVSS